MSCQSSTSCKSKHAAVQKYKAKLKARGFKFDRLIYIQHSVFNVLKNRNDHWFERSHASANIIHSCSMPGFCWLSFAFAGSTKQLMTSARQNQEFRLHASKQTVHFQATAKPAWEPWILQCISCQSSNHMLTLCRAVQINAQMQRCLCAWHAECTCHAQVFATSANPTDSTEPPQRVIRITIIACLAVEIMHIRERKSLGPTNC